jgi:hypothetical protein
MILYFDREIYISYNTDILKTYSVFALFYSDMIYVQETKW